jgi:hypothetical protein
MIRDDRRRGLVAAAACIALVAFAPAAHATMRADLDVATGALALTDVDGTPDVVTLSDRIGGPFVQVAKGSVLGTVCAATGDKFPGFQCPAAASLRIDTGGGNDVIDARRISAPLQVTLGPGADVVQTGSGADHVVVADGERDVVDCAGGQDVVEGVADPNDDIASTCETVQRSFVPAMLPKALTVGPTTTIAVPIGRAEVPLGFVATLTTAPAKGSSKKGKKLAQTTVAQGTGPIALSFKLPRVSKGFLSRRPDLRVQMDITAIGADGRRYPLSLHPGSAGTDPKAQGLHDNQLRLKIPARLRHPHGH